MDRILEEDQESLELFTTIPGVDKANARKIIAETGTEMEVFRNEKRLAKWSGICPGNNESAGKKSGRSAHGQQIFKVCPHRSVLGSDPNRGTYLRAKYDAMAARKGKAFLIIRHKILCAAYHILSSRQSYQAFDVGAFENMRHQRCIDYLQKELEKLGALS